MSAKRAGRNKGNCTSARVSACPMLFDRGIIELYGRGAPLPRATSRRDHFPRARALLARISPAGLVKKTSLTLQDFRSRIRPDTWKTFPLCHRPAVPDTRTHTRAARRTVVPSDAVLRLSNCLASSFLCLPCPRPRQRQTDF